MMKTIDDGQNELNGQYKKEKKEKKNNCTYFDDSQYTQIEEKTYIYRS